MTSARGRLGALLVAVGATLAACLPPAPPGSANGTPSRPFLGAGGREDRVLVASYPTINAIAVSRRYVYAAAQDTPGGIVVYDRFRNAWLPPLGVGDALGDLLGGGPLRAMAADPVDDALWIGTPGQLRIYRPGTDQWVQLPITGTPDLIAFPRPGAGGALTPLGAGDAWVRASGQWIQVSRVGMALPASAPPPAGALQLPPSPAALMAQFPALRTLAGGAPVARRANRPLQAFPALVAAMAPDRAGDAWVGTAGAGLLQVDAFSGAVTPRPYGLLSPGVGALAPALDGVWVGGAGVPSARAGLTYANTDLQQWRHIDGTIAVPLQGVRVLALATRGAVAWMGTERGLVRVALDGDGAMTRWTVLDGLPDDRVLAVAPRPEGAWAATLRGLVFVHDAAPIPDRRTRGVGARWLEGQPVWALQPVGDTLWLGTENGLVALAPIAPNAQGAALALPPQAGDAPGRQPVRALAAADTVLVAATDQQLLWRPASARQPGAAWQAVPVDLRTIGRVQRVAADAHSVFVAGTDGVLQWQRHTGAIRRLTIPADLPGPALDLVAATGWLWVGTPAGLLRLRRDDTGAVWP